MFSLLAALFMKGTMRVLKNFTVISQNCSFWLPVTPVTKELCMKFVSGSHKWGKWFIPINFGSLENYSRVSEMDSDRAFENAPEIDTESENYDLLSWDLEVCN